MATEHTSKLNSLVNKARTFAREASEAIREIEKDIEAAEKAARLEPKRITIDKPQTLPVVTTRSDEPVGPPVPCPTGAPRPLTEMLESFYSELNKRINALPLGRRDIAALAGGHPNSLLFLGKPIGRRPTNARVGDFPRLFNPTLLTLKKFAEAVDKAEMAASGNINSDPGLNVPHDTPEDVVAVNRAVNG